MRHWVNKFTRCPCRRFVSVQAKAGSCRRCCESSFFALEIPEGIFFRYVCLLSRKGFSMSLLSFCEISMVNLISHFNCITRKLFFLLKNASEKINGKCQLNLFALFQLFVNRNFFHQNVLTRDDESFM